MQTAESQEIGRQIGDMRNRRRAEKQLLSVLFSGER